MLERHQSEEELAELPALLRILPRFASTLAICIGALALTGWFFDIELLKRISRSFVAMNPATAVLFILAGVALAVSIGKNRSAAAAGFAKILAGLILLAALAKLIGLAANWHPNVDEILFVSKLGGPENKMPNRIAPNTALNFVLIGLSLVTLDWPIRRFAPSQLFAALTGFGALLPIIGYAFKLESFRGLAAFIPMAFHTAITFLILAGGLVFARPETRLAQIFASRDSRGVLARRLLPSAIVLTLLLGWLRLLGEQLDLYDGRFGLVLYAFGNCVLFGLLICWTVLKLGDVEMGRTGAIRALAESKWQLQESLTQVQLIFNHARDLICTLDKDGCIISANAACKPIFGFSEQQLTGRSFCELHAAEDRARIEKAFRDLRAGLTVSNFPAQCQRHEGGFAGIEWSLQRSQHYEKTFCFGREAVATNG